MLRQRILTAIILIPLFVALILLLPAKHFSIVTGLIVLWGAWEWSGFLGIKHFPQNALYPSIIFLLLLMLMYFLYHHEISVQIILYASLVFWTLALVLVLIYPKASHFWGSGMIMRGLMGVMVLLPCWVSLNFIRLFPNGPFLVLFLFVLVWTADTGAYFAGKWWGKQKLIPEVSPGKTWQGLFGALISTILLVAGIALWFHSPAAVWQPLLILSLTTVLFSILGDLFESMLKRKAKLKDSGNLLPGHGGILDRIDSLTAAAPMFALGALILG